MAETKTFPLKLAYPFAEKNGCGREAEIIRRTEILWPKEKNYTSSVRRGQLIELFKERGIFDKFLAECWNQGRTKPGKSEIRQKLKILSDYREYIRQNWPLPLEIKSTKKANRPVHKINQGRSTQIQGKEKQFGKLQKVNSTNLSREKPPLRIEKRKNNQKSRETAYSPSNSQKKETPERRNSRLILKEVANKLIKHHKPDDWHWLGAGAAVSKKDANKFFLGAILDYQIPAATAWGNSRRLTEDIFHNPDDIWARITSCSKNEWMGRRTKYRLHRFPIAHERVWRIGNDIVRDYQGDVRNIWNNQSAEVVLKRLNNMRVGKQISQMILGALFDVGILRCGGDVKADIHVRRVLGRVTRGREFDLAEIPQVVELTRKMHPEEPWLLDQQLYLLGKQVCFPNNPVCSRCYLSNECHWRQQ